ncbi:MAG: hypothetical protein KKH34_09835 [Candidatus Omnitrophica bacterium]|nr:hypothetical protein [Candidatus Omnitrophota bacterium]MCG2703015.1 hypothetical protein [Candidatus Omnitrophota bacterium]
MKRLNRLSQRNIFFGMLVTSCVLVLMSYAPQACFPQAGTAQDVQLTAYLNTAPAAAYGVVVTQRIIDTNNVNRFCDPSGRSDMQALVVVNRVTMGREAPPNDNVFLPLPAGVITGTTTTNWSVDFNAQGGDARFSSLNTTGRITMGDPGPIDERTSGKYVYDVAEYITVSEGEPADVVVISDAADLTLTRSAQPFDTKVAGVISEDPKVSLGTASDSDTKPLALAGIVRCNATTENGPIKKGDMLVSSSEPGYAMAADVKDITPGMIVGSALEALPAGRGKIYILVN